MKKELMLFSALVAASAVLWAEPPDPSVALRQACKGVAKFSADLTLAPAVRQPADQALKRERGWSEVHSILATVSDQPSKRVATDLKATGHRCTFDVSVDMKTVAVSKRACMSLCKDEAFADQPKVPYMALFGTDGSRQYLQ